MKYYCLNYKVMLYYLLIILSIIIHKTHTINIPLQNYNFNDDEEIWFGQSAALSGLSKSLGFAARNGILMAFHEFNTIMKKAKINKKLKLLTLDDAYEPNYSKQNSDFFIYQTFPNTNSLTNSTFSLNGDIFSNEKKWNKKIFGLVGYIGTPTIEISFQDIVNSEIPLIGPFSGTRWLRTPFRSNIINVRASYDDEAAAMINWVTNVKLIKKVAIFYQNDSFGLSGVDSFQRVLNHLNIPIRSSSTFKRNTLEVEDAAYSLGKGNPDAIICIGSHTPVAKFIKTVKDIEIYPNLHPTNKYGYENLNDIIFLTMKLGSNAMAAILDDYGKNVPENVPNDIYLKNVIIAQLTPSPTNTSYPLVKSYHRAKRTFEAYNDILSYRNITEDNVDLFLDNFNVENFTKNGVKDVKEGDLVNIFSTSDFNPVIIELEGYLLGKIIYTNLLRLIGKDITRKNFINQFYFGGNMNVELKGDLNGNTFIIDGETFNFRWCNRSNTIDYYLQNNLQNLLIISQINNITKSYTNMSQNYLNSIFMDKDNYCIANDFDCNQGSKVLYISTIERVNLTNIATNFHFKMISPFTWITNNEQKLTTCLSDLNYVNHPIIFSRSIFVNGNLASLQQDNFLGIGITASFHYRNEKVGAGGNSKYSKLELLTKYHNDTKSLIKNTQEFIEIYNTTGFIGYSTNLLNFGQVNGKLNIKIINDGTITKEVESQYSNIFTNKPIIELQDTSNSILFKNLFLENLIFINSSIMEELVILLKYCLTTLGKTRFSIIYSKKYLEIFNLFKVLLKNLDLNLESEMSIENSNFELNNLNVILQNITNNGNANPQILILLLNDVDLINSILSVVRKSYLQSTLQNYIKFRKNLNIFLINSIFKKNIEIEMNSILQNFTQNNFNIFYTSHIPSFYENSDNFITKYKTAIAMKYGKFTTDFCNNKIFEGFLTGTFVATVYDSFSLNSGTTVTDTLFLRKIYDVNTIYNDQLQFGPFYNTEKTNHVKCNLGLRTGYIYQFSNDATLKFTQKYSESFYSAEKCGVSVLINDITTELKSLISFNNNYNIYDFIYNNNNNLQLSVYNDYKFYLENFISSTSVFNRIVTIISKPLIFGRVIPYNKEELLITILNNQFNWNNELNNTEITVYNNYNDVYYDLISDLTFNEKCDDFTIGLKTYFFYYANKNGNYKPHIYTEYFISNNIINYLENINTKNIQLKSLLLTIFKKFTYLEKIKNVIEKNHIFSLLGGNLNNAFTKITKNITKEIEEFKGILQRSKIPYINTISGNTILRKSYSEYMINLVPSILDETITMIKYLKSTAFCDGILSNDKTTKTCQVSIIFQKENAYWHNSNNYGEENNFYENLKENLIVKELENILNSQQLEMGFTTELNLKYFENNFNKTLLNQENIKTIKKLQLENIFTKITKSKTNILILIGNAKPIINLMKEIINFNNNLYFGILSEIANDPTFEEYFLQQNENLNLYKNKIFTPRIVKLPEIYQTYNSLDYNVDNLYMKSLLTNYYDFLIDNPIFYLNNFNSTIELFNINKLKVNYNFLNGYLTGNFIDILLRRANELLITLYSDTLLNVEKTTSTSTTSIKNRIMTLVDNKYFTNNIMLLNNLKNDLLTLMYTTTTSNSNNNIELTNKITGKLLLEIIYKDQSVFDISDMVIFGPMGYGCATNSSTTSSTNNLFSNYCNCNQGIHTIYLSNFGVISNTSQIIYKDITTFKNQFDTCGEQVIVRPIPLLTIILVVSIVSIVIIILIILTITLTCRFYQNKKNFQFAPKFKKAGKIAVAFTDIQNSTVLWQSNEQAMKASLIIHNQIMRKNLELYRGYEVKTNGDSFFVVFSDALDALDWAIQTQYDLAFATWPSELYKSFDCRQEWCAESKTIIWSGLRVRIGLHWGRAEYQWDKKLRRPDYFGTAINTAARIEAMTCGGQVLISEKFFLETFKGYRPGTVSPFHIYKEIKFRNDNDKLYVSEVSLHQTFLSDGLLRDSASTTSMMTGGKGSKKKNSPSASTTSIATNHNVNIINNNNNGKGFKNLRKFNKRNKDNLYYLEDIGEHYLKGLKGTTRVFQVKSNFMLKRTYPILIPFSHTLDLEDDDVQTTNSTESYSVQMMRHQPQQHYELNNAEMTMNNNNHRNSQMTIGSNMSGVMGEDNGEIRVHRFSRSRGNSVNNVSQKSFRKSYSSNIVLPVIEEKVVHDDEGNNDDVKNMEKKEE